MSDNGQLKHKSQLREIWRTQPKKPNHRHPGRGKPAPSAPVGALAHLRAGRVRNGAAKHNQSTTRSRSMKPSSIIQVQHVASSQRRQVEVEAPAFGFFPSAYRLGVVCPPACSPLSGIAILAFVLWGSGLVTSDHKLPQRRRIKQCSPCLSAAGVGLLSPRAYPAPVKNGHNSIRQASK